MPKPVITQLLNVLRIPAEVGGRSLRIAGFSGCEELTLELLKVPELSRAEVVHDISEADVVIGWIKCLRSGMLLSELKLVRGHSIVIISDAAGYIHVNPSLIRDIVGADYVKSWFPIGEGAAVFIKRGFDRGFKRRSISVYRDSFIYGPNPVHYNTAYALYVLTKYTLARVNGNVIEVGTGRGFSTLWLAHAAKELKARVTSIDVNCERVEFASNVMKELGLSEYVEVVCGDAREYGRSIKGIALAFIDGWKEEYHEYLEAIEHNLLPGSVLIAHNTLSSAPEVAHYLKKVFSREYVSVTVATDPAGVTVSARTKD